MRSPQELIEGYRAFRRGTYCDQAELYETLGKGQNPNVMLIACADSRAEPSDIFNAAPGQLFVMRNVANLVPPYETGGGQHGVSAALEFAVTALEVEHIVIMGHGGCGGVQASLSAADHNPVGEFIAPWVKLLDKARDKVLSENPDDPQTALEFAGVEASLANLMTFPFVSERVASGKLSLHGAWFAIALGELYWRSAETGKFELIEA
ncbi:carbonic anhydrase [Henriciella marina]|uniref:carbonic anhydrase n=1 Tax=Henriciella marina TaxID=453851 RepID=UPI000364075E|nr:carbonic anhydrase [Henriciella marina]